ncbi:MAG TPA: CYTH domain-containing protein [Solirubrobacteraceae bacterium]|nr:CYTH domain-containing protein [Solirubrobacteraceae bacterium]
MDGQEVERKWLVAEVPGEVLGTEGEPIEQGYLAIEADGGEVRLRRRAGRCFLTTKSGHGLVRRELEIEIAPEQFDVLWPATDGRRLEKTRRVVELSDGRLSVELDEYGGGLAGLRVAEVEFPDEDSARSFRPPAWFADEVTDRGEYRNRSLAVRGTPPAAE